MLRSALILGLGISLVACGDKSEYAGLAPNSYVVEDVSKQENPYSAFVSAYYAEIERDDQLATELYLEALNHSPDDAFISQKAFFQMVMSGRLLEASSIAGSIDEEHYLAGIAKMLSAANALKNGDGDTLLAVSQTIDTGAFGFILRPLFTAWAEAKVGRHQLAMAALDELGDEPVLKGLALSHKAYIYDYLGMRPEAEAAYKAVSQSRYMGSMQPIIAYADFLYREKRAKEARTFLTAEMSRRENNFYLLREANRLSVGIGPSVRTNSPPGAMSNFFYRLASESMGQQRLDLMAIIYGRLSEFLYPNNMDMRLLMGDALTKSERFEDAAVSFGSVPQSSPAYLVAQSRLVETLRAGGFYDRAASEVNEQLLKSPNNYRLYRSLANIYQEAGHCSDAIVYYDRIINARGRRSEDLADDFFGRGACHDELGNWPKAQMDLWTAYELAPDDPLIQNYLGYSLLERGVQLDKALEMIGNAAALEPENGSILDSLGWLHFKTGDFDKALYSLEKAVKLAPQNPTISEHLGDVYWALGRKREARFQWRHALATATDKTETETIETKLFQGLQNIPERYDGVQND